MLKLAGKPKIVKYQKAHGLKVTGRDDAATRAKVRVHNKNAAKVKTKATAKAAPKVVDPYAAPVKAAVDLKFNQANQDVQGQIRASDQQQANIHGWYGDYLQAVNAAATRTQQGYQDAAGQIAGAADKSSATDAGNRQQLAAQMAADAAKRGATVDPSIAATGAQAEASRRTGLDEAQAATVRTGANQGAYLADRGRVGAMAEVGAHTAESGRKTTLVQKKADLKGQAADYGQQVRQSLADQDFKNQVAEQGLGIKIKQTAISAQNSKTSQKLASSLVGDRKAKNKLTARQQKITKRHNDALQAIAQQNANTAAGRAETAREQDAYKRQHHLGPYKPGAGGGPSNFTPSQRRTARGQFDTASAALRSLTPKTLKTKTPQEIIDGLVVVNHIPQSIARAAWETHAHGGVSPATRRRVRQKTGFAPPLRKKAAPRSLGSVFGIG